MSIPLGKTPKISPDDDRLDIPEADRCLFGRRVLEQYAAGKSAEAIALEEGCDHWTIHKLIREAAAAARDKSRSMVEDCFLRQKTGLDVLIRTCMEAIERAAAAKPTPYFDKEAVKCLIMVYDRQSKLLGMDRGRETSGYKEYEWMKGATEADLRKRAEAMGIRLPEPIATTDA